MVATILVSGGWPCVGQTSVPKRRACAAHSREAPPRWHTLRASIIAALERHHAQPDGAALPPRPAQRNPPLRSILQIWQIQTTATVVGAEFRRTQCVCDVTRFLEYITKYGWIYIKQTQNTLPVQCVCFM
jgi:hypothetical protein